MPDVAGPNLRIVFCGINPGLYSGAVGHHFARPGNRFWRALHPSGLTDRVLSAFEERELLSFGLGITNLVNRATAVAAEVSDQELREGGSRLRRKVFRLGPRFVAFLGLGAFRVAFRRPEAKPGPQDDVIGRSGVWLLPNPSGLNAHYQLAALADAFAELRSAAYGEGPSGSTV